MDKIAAYKEQIYKQAARRWKRDIGAMSESDRQRLLDSKVLDYEKEIAGLNAGSENIAKKQNFDHRKFGFFDAGKRWKKILKSHPSYESKPGKTLTAYGSALTSKILGGGNLSLVDPSEKVRPVAYKGKFGKIIAANNLLDKKDNLSNRYADAIANRHEVDEIREAKKVYNDQKKYRNINGTKEAYTRAQSHISPKVIARESANVAVAPKTVRDAFMNFRDRTNERSSYDFTMDMKKNPSSWFLKEDTTPWYGQSGVYNKKDGKILERESIRLNKPLVDAKQIPVKVIKQNKLKDLAKNILKKIRK